MLRVKSSSKRCLHFLEDNVVCGSRVDVTHSKRSTPLPSPLLEMLSSLKARWTPAGWIANWRVCMWNCVGLKARQRGRTFRTPLILEEVKHIWLKQHWCNRSKIVGQNTWVNLWSSIDWNNFVPGRKGLVQQTHFTAVTEHCATSVLSKC